MTAAVSRSGMVGGRTARRVASLLLFTASVVLGLAGVGVFWLHLMSDPFTDFRVYYDAAARLNAGLPLYPPGSRIYPPLFEIALRPLALLPYEVAAVIWVVIILGAFALTLRRLGLRRQATWYAVGLLGIGIGWSLAIGQAEVLIALLLTLGSPPAVAVAGNIKLFPLLVGIYWLARQDWHSVRSLVAWTAGLVVLQLVLEPADTLAFPTTLGLVGGQISEGGEHVLSPYATSPVLWVALLLVGVVAAMRLGRTRWGWASAVAVAVLASPHLLAYMLMSLLACLRQPHGADNENRVDPVDARTSAAHASRNPRPRKQSTRCAARQETAPGVTTSRLGNRSRSPAVPEVGAV